ncbi:nucleotide-binding alpha-beta plait domain-containing protein [Tanacetum coccineum]
MINHLLYCIDYIDTNTTTTTTSHHSATSCKSSSKSQTTGSYNPSANHATVLLTTITKPTSFTVANNSLEWHQAMKEEYDALMKNETWSLVPPRASNTDVVDGKWVYRLKRDKNGAITHYKARFAAKGNNKGTIDNIICQLGSAFALKDLRPLNYFLGIEIVPHVSGILIFQKKYILELLESARLSNCNPVSSRMVTSSSLSLDDTTAFSNPVKYRQVVGSLQYVTLSRLDIAFVINICMLQPRIIVSQYLDKAITNSSISLSKIQAARCCPSLACGGVLDQTRLDEPSNYIDGPYPLGYVLFA